MKLLLLISFVFLAVIAFSQSNSPTVIATGGDYYENASGSLSWTLGETVTETVSDGTNTMTQGFQQNSYTITEITEIVAANFNIKVYPNPASDFINIEGKDIEVGKVEMYDLNGKLVISKEVNNNNYQLNMQDKTVAYYLLKVYSKDKLIVKEYKICKTQ